MNNEYGHIVYTRRQTGYSQDGTPHLRTGHGIFSLSSNVASSEKDKDFFDDVINLRRVAAGEEATEYSYVIPSIGEPMFGKYRNRTAEEEKVAAEANVDARGTFIMEWLVGEPQKYSFEYFDSPFFSADSLPIPEYYKDEPVPIETNISADTVPVGPMTRKEVMDFANDGRAVAVRQAVAVLLNQLSQPESERKMIVIRDTEVSVRKWIAAILYSFPVCLANKISYDTRRINFNNEPSTCYYVMKTTNKYVRMRNLQDPNQERRLYSLIAGAEPSDRSSVSLNNPMPNRPYLIIDGQTKQATFSTQVPEQAYFKVLITDDGKVESFTSFAAELDNVTFGNLAELFDAIQIVSDEEKWEYSALLQSLNVLAPHLTEKSVLVSYVLSKLCIEDGYRRFFASIDEKNSLKLFSLLQHIATQFGISQVSAMLLDYAAIRIEQYISSVDSSALKLFNSSLKTQSSATYEYAARKTVLTNGFRTLDVRTVQQAGPAYAVELIDMISCALRTEKKSWNEYMGNSANQELIDELIRLSLTNEQLTGVFVNKLSGNTSTIEFYISRGTEIMPDIRTGENWWRILLKCGVSIGQICQIIAKAGIPVDEIENLLCVELRSKGYSNEIKSLYNKYLTGKPNVGTKFFQEWFNVIQSKQKNEKEIDAFLSEARTYPNLAQFYRNTVLKLDSEIPFDKNGSAYVGMLKTFLIELRLYEVSNTILWEFLMAIGSTKTGGLFGKNKDALSNQYAKANPNHLVYQVRQDITHSELFEDFMSVLEESQEDQHVFLIGLGSFQFATQNMYHAYIDRFARMVCEYTLKHKGFGGLGSLMDYFVYHRKTNGMDNTTLLSANLSETLYRIEQMLGEEKTEGISDKVVAKTNKEYGEATANEVEALFGRAQDYYKKNHKSGFFGKLFGK